MPVPEKGETRSAYIKRCVKVRQMEHPEEDVDQSVAICSSMWDQYKKKQRKRRRK